MKSIRHAMVAVLLSALPSRGELLVSYEGNGFPEDQGWTRGTLGLGDPKVLCSKCHE